MNSDFFFCEKLVLSPFAISTKLNKDDEFFNDMKSTMKLFLRLVMKFLRLKYYALGF
jgi:hypothetical protein